MDVIDNMLVHMVLFFLVQLPIVTVFHVVLYYRNFNLIFYLQFKEDPSFKPQGGRLGENDMDYDADEKSMATLRRHLRGAREEYYRCKRYSYCCWLIHKLVLHTCAAVECCITTFCSCVLQLIVCHFHINMPFCWSNVS